MKTLLTLFLLFAVSPFSRADEARFFRIVGPVSTTITRFTADGYVTWTNVPTNAIFTVQTATSLFGETNWVDYFQVAVTNDVTAQRIYDPNPPSDMVLIPAGTFAMGSCMSPYEGFGDEHPLHEVFVSAFYMDRYDIWKSQCDGVYEWATNHGYSFDNAGSGKRPGHPVQWINWYDCVKWCNARSEKEGLIPCYCTDSRLITVYRSGDLDISNSCVNWAANGYRLPTEVEWEKAARGGLSGHRFPWGDTISESQANYHSTGNEFVSYDLSDTGYNPLFSDGVDPFTSPVGFFAPNAYGLYDMAGNVWQWCWDFYDENWYNNVEATHNDTHGPMGGALFGYRVLRGGSWYEDAFFARCSVRNYSFPGAQYDDYGFRCVRKF